MINLDKFNTQFDINNIDPRQIIKVLIENQKIIVIVITIGALIMAVVMFQDYRAKGAAVHTRLSQVQGKLDLIKARDTAIKDLGSYKSSIPKALTVFDLVTLIQNYAKSNDTTVTSYTPSQSKDMGLYDEIDVSFDVASNDFKGVMFFIRKIEKSKFPILINSLVGHEDDDGRITLKLAISAILIHP